MFVELTEFTLSKLGGGEGPGYVLNHLCVVF